MVWKQSINTTSEGDTAKFGAANINKISKLFSGDADVDTVTINSPFIVQNGKLQVATITNTGLLTLPTATTTLIGSDTTDTLTNKTWVHSTTHKTGGTDAIKLDELAAPTDITTLNSSITTHGLLKKLSNISTDFMNGVGDWATPSPPPTGAEILTRYVTNNDITNTTAETDLFSYSVGADVLGTTNIINVNMRGTFAANSGTPTIIVRVKYGATTMYQDTSFAFAASSFVGIWSMDLMFYNKGATNSQEIIGPIRFSNRAATTTGSGDIGSTTPGPTHQLQGIAAEDSTAANDLKITIQWLAANASYSFKRTFGLLELID